MDGQHVLFHILLNQTSAEYLVMLTNLSECDLFEDLNQFMVVVNSNCSNAQCLLGSTSPTMALLNLKLPI